MSDNRQLQKISTSWGDIVVQMRDGKVSSCTLPYVDDTPTEPFTISTTEKNAIEIFVCDTFRGQPAGVPPIAELQGSSFQNMVWLLLSKIPSGETKSYREIAEALGKPLAYRAVVGMSVPARTDQVAADVRAFAALEDPPADLTASLISLGLLDG